MTTSKLSRFIFMSVANNFGKRMALPNARFMGHVSSRVHRLSSPALINHCQRNNSTTASLGSFLADEIEAEKEIAEKQLQGGASPQMPGFSIATDDADITLSKDHGSERINVRFNVNHTVRMDPELEAQEDPPKDDTADVPTMVAMPQFQVEISKGEQKLTFACEFDESLAGVETEQEGNADLFVISEIWMHTGDSSSVDDKVYSVSGDVMDGNLYEHLMDYLDERGINSEFAENLVRFATHYEHAQYVALLQKIKDFAGR